MAADNLARITIIREGADEKVVARAQAGSPQATEHLLRKYRSLVVGKARSYYLAGADREDVVQEGMIGLFKAIRNFSGSNPAAFRSFAELCVTRQIISAVKAATRQKHLPLNLCLSVEAAREEETEERGGVSEEAIADRPSDPLELLLSRELRAEIEAVIERVLSALEAAVLRRFLEGFSYREIAAELGCGVKRVDNALQRAKKKISRSLATVLI